MYNHQTLVFGIGGGFILLVSVLIYLMNGNGGYYGMHSNNYLNHVYWPYNRNVNNNNHNINNRNNVNTDYLSQIHYAHAAPALGRIQPSHAHAQHNALPPPNTPHMYSQHNALPPPPPLPVLPPQHNLLPPPNTPHMYSQHNALPPPPPGPVLPPPQLPNPGLPVHISQLLQPRQRPGNPRARQTYINKYGSFQSTSEPDFNLLSTYDWMYYGKDRNDNMFKGLFMNSAATTSIQLMKRDLGLDDIEFSKLSMGNRAAFYKSIQDNCDDIVEIFENNNPIKSDANINDDTAIQAAIDQALAADITPEDFRLKNPRIAANKNNLNWYINAYDAQKREQEKIERKEACDDFEMNDVQQQLVDMTAQWWTEYNQKYPTSAKKALYGNRNLYVIISPDGNIGLTTSFKYLKFSLGDEKVCIIGGSGESKNIILNYHSQIEKCTNCELLCWNVTREDYKNWSWSAPEQICDALTTTPKYNSVTKNEASPIVVIGTNHMFALKNMATDKPLITLDRINMFRVTSTRDEIVPVDVYKYYKKVYGDDLRIQVQPRADEEFDIATL